MFRLMYQKKSPLFNREYIFFNYAASRVKLNLRFKTQTNCF